jgi:anti-sigma factor RsiW
VSGPPDFELVPEMLSAYLDDELAAPERAAVEARLEASADWRGELEAVRSARAAVRSLAALDAPPGFWDAVLAHVGSEPDDRAETVAPPRALTARRPRRRVAWLAAAAAAVAGIVVAVIAVPHRSEVTPNVTAVVAQHGAQGSDAGDPVSMLAPVGPLAGFRR